eukprot:GHVR01037331.1.p2 GENE.GHVR01037331.1~~GHVR01037331.1.p2  ORF type:complete len:128 (-),score=11.54 GHVR01037331.1:180-563(-)
MSQLECRTHPNSRAPWKEKTEALRTTFHYTALPFDMWPAVAIGMASVVNTTVDSARGASPWMLRFNSSPSEHVLYGHSQAVLILPPKPATSPKTLEPAGRIAIYLGLSLEPGSAWVAEFNTALGCSQ